MYRECTRLTSIWNGTMVSSLQWNQVKGHKHHFRDLSTKIPCSCYQDSSTVLHTYSQFSPFEHALLKPHCIEESNPCTGSRGHATKSHCCLCWNDMCNNELRPREACRDSQKHRGPMEGYSPSVMSYLQAGPRGPLTETDDSHVMCVYRRLGKPIMTAHNRRFQQE